MDQKELEKLSQDFANFQNELNEMMQSRQKLETQYQENKIVAAEFSQIKDDKDSGKLEEYPKIFKQTGSVLLPVEFKESETNVNKRIEFITSEIERLESKIKKTNSSLEKTRDELIKIRTAMSG